MRFLCRTYVSRYQHERVKTSSRTCRGKFTIFLEITQVNFLKKLTYPVNVFHV